MNFKTVPATSFLLFSPKRMSISPFDINTNSLSAVCQRCYDLFWGDELNMAQNSHMSAYDTECLLFDGRVT